MPLCESGLVLSEYVTLTMLRALSAIAVPLSRQSASAPSAINRFIFAILFYCFFFFRTQRLASAITTAATAAHGSA